MAKDQQDSGPGSPARVTRGLPNMVVRVVGDSTVCHPTADSPDGQHFVAGDEFVCEGPLAQELVLQGHVMIVGQAE